MKRNIVFTFLVFCVFLCACRQEYALSSQEFSDAMLDLGYSVEDHTEYMDQDMSFNRGEGEEIIAYGNSFCVVFTKRADVQAATDDIRAWQKYYEIFSKSEKLIQNDRAIHYRYTAQNGTERIFVAVRIDNTHVSADAGFENQKKVLELFEEIGYIP